MPAWRALPLAILAATTGAVFMLAAPSRAASNDNFIENVNGQPYHGPTITAWPGGPYTYRDSADIQDTMAPRFLLSVWANDITGATLNWNAGSGWNYYTMSYLTDQEFKSYWTTGPLVDEIQALPPGTLVQYDFKLQDGLDQNWLKSDGFFDVPTAGTPWTFTVEGISATPTHLMADSSSSATVSCWVTNQGNPVAGQTVTFTFVSGPGAFVSNNARSITAVTDANGRANVQIFSGYAGVAVVQASSADFTTATTSVTFSSFLIDGNDADFPARYVANAMSDNDSKIAEGTWVWRDAVGDARPAADISSPPWYTADNFDIREVRMTGSSDSFRVLVSMKDGDGTKYPMVMLAIDTDVRRDTASTAAGPGPGLASSVRDNGNWWLPAAVFTGTRHLGAPTANDRGERQQQDQWGGGDDSLYSHNWRLDGDNAMDGGADSTINNKRDPSITANRTTESGGGNPDKLKWDYCPISNELYVAMSDYRGDADHFLWVANETTTNTLAWFPGYWNKSGRVMHFDFFAVRSDGSWYQGTQVSGRNWMGGVALNSNVPFAEVTTDTDDDNRGMAYFRSNTDNPTLEGRIDLDDLFGETGVTNGSLYVVASAFGPNDGDGAWDGVPDDMGGGAGSLIGDTRFQQIWIERPSSPAHEQVAEWERAITFNNQVPGGGKSGTAIWYAPGGRSIGARRREFPTTQSYLDVANGDTFEFGARWSDLFGGVRPPFTLRFTIGIGASASGGTFAFENYRYFRGVRPNATSAYGIVPAFLDVVSNLSTASELNDSDVDYFVDVDFNRDGRVNTTPDTATNLGIVESGETTIRGPGAILNDATPIFRWTWNDTDGVNSIKHPAWQLQVFSNAAHTTLVQEKFVENDSATQWEYAGAALTPGVTYYWRVRTRDDFGWGPWTFTNAMYAGGRTDSFSFRINSAPNPPTYLRVDGETNPTTLQSANPKFSWRFSDPDANDGQKGFAIEVYNGTVLVHAETNITSNEYWVYPDTAPPLEGGSRYNWRVRYWDLNSAYSTWTPTSVPGDSTFGTEYTSPGVRDLKIAQIGQGHATYGDYAMIWNPLDTVVKLAGMSFQRWSATVGTSWAAVRFGLKDTIPAGGYYLIAQNDAAGRDTVFTAAGANFVIGGAQGLALVRNYSQVASTTDSDIVDGVGFGQTVDTTNLATGVIDNAGEVVIRRATSSANTLYGLTRDSDLRFAGHYLDGNETSDWATGGTLQDPRGRASVPSRLDFRVEAATIDRRTVEAGVPFTARVTAIDYYGQKVSDTAASAYVDRAKFRVSPGFSVSPATSTGVAFLGTLLESVTISASTGGCTLYADTTMALDTTGIGVIGGETRLVVVSPAPPTKPIVTFPAHGAYIANPCTVTWTASYDTTPPVRYRVQVSKSDTFGFAIVADTIAYDTYLALGPLTPPDSFYLRVAAIDPGGYTDTSTTIAFRVVRQVAYFELHETDPAIIFPTRTVRRGVAFNLRIIARDTTGATVTTFQDTLTLSVSGGTITPSTIVFRLADNGDTTCSVTISGSGASRQDTISVDSGGTLVARIVVVPLHDNRLIINEVYPTDTNTSSNQDRDEWVEILNRSNTSVSTNGWLLTDYEADIALPDVTIPSGKSLVVHMNEAGVIDTTFTDTDGAAHYFPYSTGGGAGGRLSYHQEELGLYSSLTKESTYIASYVAWANAATWAGQSQADALGAGIWETNATVNHGSASALALAGRSIYRIRDGGDTILGTGDWRVWPVRDTYVFTEGFLNTLNDTDLTGVLITLRSGSGSTDSVGIGETLVVRLTATGGGDPGTQGVVTVMVTSKADPSGIVLTLKESTNSSRLYEQTVLVTSFTESGSRDGMRWIGVGASDSIFVRWVKGETSAITTVTGALDHFDVTAPVTATNGYDFPLVVTARTRFGFVKSDYTGTINLTVSSGSISPTSNTFVAGDGGVDTFNVTISGASTGPCTITVTDAVTGETGVAVVTIMPVSLVINEIMANAGDGAPNVDWDGSGTASSTADEWVELYNRSDSPVGLAGWRVGQVTVARALLGDTIEPRGFLVVYRRTAGSAMGVFYDSTGLPLRTRTFTGGGAMGPLLDGGGRVVLTNNTGDTIDDVTHPALLRDSSYMRAWDGGGSWITNAKPSVDTPTPLANRDSVMNMRFRVELQDTAHLGDTVLLRVVAYNISHTLPYGETTTAFTQSGVPIELSDGGSINVTTLDFTGGVCSTYVVFSGTAGVKKLTVRYNISSIGRDTIELISTVGPPVVELLHMTGVSDSNFYAGVGLIETTAANPADTVWTNSIDTVILFCTVTVSGGVGRVVTNQILNNAPQIDTSAPYVFSFVVNPYVVHWGETTIQFAAYDTGLTQVDTVYVKLIEDRYGPVISAVTVRPDTITDGAADSDDDRQIFVTFSVADNDSGAGVSRVNAQPNTSDNAINDSAFANTWDSAIARIGYNIYKVTARDHVGNWSPVVGWDTIQVIIRTLDDFNTVQARNLWGGDTSVFTGGAGTISIQNRTDAPLYPRDGGNFLRLTGSVGPGDSAGYSTKVGAGGADLRDSRTTWRALSFGIRSGDGSPGDLLRVQLPAGGSHEREDLWRWLPSGGATTAWQEVVIPLAAWTTADLVWGDSTIAFLFDDPAIYGGPGNPVVDIDYIRFESRIETAVLENFNETTVATNAYGGAVSVFSQSSDPSYSRVTTGQYSGWGALRFDYDYNNTTNNWQGLIQDFRPLVLQGLDALEFMIRLETGTSARPDSWGNMEVRVRSVGVEYQLMLNSYIAGLGSDWRKVRLPLAAFTALGFDEYKFDRLTLALVDATVNPVRGRLFIDDIQWVRGDTTDPAAVPIIPTSIYGQETVAQPALTWTGTTDNSGLVAYLVEVATDTSFRTLIYSTDTTVTGFVLPVAPSQAEIWWRVAAHDTHGNWTAWSESSYLRVSPPPAAPSNLAAKAVLTASPPVDTGVLISWSANTETDLVGYQVFRNVVNDSRAAGMTLLFGGLITTTSRLDSSVLPGETYYYFVVAVDSFGRRSDTAGGVTAPVFTIIKVIDSASLGLLPGSTVQYSVTVRNAGWGPADSIVVYDTIPPNKVFRDTANLVAGWEFQYCTVAAPSHAFYSADFAAGVPPDAALVRFVRWRKPRVTAGESAVVLRFRTIIP